MYRAAQLSLLFPLCRWLHGAIYSGGYIKWGLYAVGAMYSGDVYRTAQLSVLFPLAHVCACACVCVCVRTHTYISMYIRICIPKYIRT